MTDTIALKLVESGDTFSLKKCFSQVVQQDCTLLSRMMSFNEKARKIQTRLLGLQPDIGQTKNCAKLCREMIDQVEALWLLKEDVFLEFIPLASQPLSEWRMRYLEASQEDVMDCFVLCMQAINIYYHWMMRVQEKILYTTLETKTLLASQLYMISNPLLTDDAAREIGKLSERYSLFDMDYFK